DFLHLLKRHRQALELNYEREASDDDKRRQKAAIFQALRDDYAALKESWGGYSGYDRWFAKPLSNARLSAIATYHDFVPGFRALLEREGDLGKFYAAVGRLAAQSKEEREQHLAALGEQPVLAVREAAAP